MKEACSMACFMALRKRARLMALSGTHTLMTELRGLRKSADLSRNAQSEPHPMKNQRTPTGESMEEDAHPAEIC